MPFHVHVDRQKVYREQGLCGHGCRDCNLCDWIDGGPAESLENSRTRSLNFSMYNLSNSLRAYAAGIEFDADTLKIADDFGPLRDRFLQADRDCR